MQPLRQSIGIARWAGLFLVLALLLAACAPAAAPSAAPAGEAAPAASDESAAAPAPGGEVSRADTLIFAASTSDLLGLDPGAVYEFSGLQAVGNLYQTLVTFEAGMEGVQPLLAESWDIQDTGDMWTLTFKLNPAATFASGTPVTAEDVVYSWGRALDMNKSPAFLLSAVCQITKENAIAVDAGTVEVKIPKAASPQVCLTVLTFGVSSVVEKALVEANLGEDLGQTWLNDNSAGSGPYVLNSWQREVAITMDANPNYWGDAPKLKRVIMQNIQEATNRQAAIETGDADIVQDLLPEQQAALEGNPDVTLSTFENNLLIFIGMNMLMPPLDNADVREAIRYAINYDEIMQLTGKDAKLVQEVIPAGYLGYTGQNPFTQDIAKAKELLTKAGFPDGITLEALVPAEFPAGPIDYPTLAAKVQSDLALAGITLNLQQLQIGELLNKYRAQEGQVVFMLWGPDYPDPDSNAAAFSDYALKTSAFRNGWDNPEIAALSKEAALALTPEERVKLYAELTERIFHEGPYAVLYQPTRTFGVRNDIEGFDFLLADTPQVSFAQIGRK